MNWLHQLKFELLPTSVLVWSYTATSLASTAFEQTTVFIFWKEKSLRKTYTDMLDKITFNVFELGALCRADTRHFTSPTAIWFTKNWNPTCAVYGAKTGDLFPEILSSYYPLQLDCLLVTSWDPCHNFCWRVPILNPRPVLDSSPQTTRGMILDFLVKPQNVFFAFFC